jgi:hypothetical protein
VGANRYTVIHHTSSIVWNICDLLERPSFRCSHWHIYLNERYGDKYEFEEHCYRTECPSNAVMCWVLCRTWTAEEFDVVEFYNTLVCRTAREPSLYP